MCLDALIGFSVFCILSMDSCSLGEEADDHSVVILDIYVPYEHLLSFLFSVLSILSHLLAKLGTSIM